MDPLKTLSRRSTTRAAAIAAAMLGLLAVGGAAEAATNCPNTPQGAPGPYKVDFAVGSARIADANTKTLDEVANFAKTRYAKVCLLGRADKQGSQQANAALSVRRAEAVAAALRKRGVSAKSITVVGHGEAYGDWLNILNQSQADHAVDITLSQ
jgi:outer membrane protein OmpA-like peptidoglycan-associated protein